jgi:hypothetical protein
VKREETVTPAPPIAASAACQKYLQSQTITIPSGSGADLNPVRVCILPGGSFTLINECGPLVNVLVTGPVVAGVAQFQLQKDAQLTIPLGPIQAGPLLDTITVWGCPDQEGGPKTGTLEIGTNPGEDPIPK